MELRDQLITPEQALELKKLGVKQDSAFIYARRKTGCEPRAWGILSSHLDNFYDSYIEYASAFTSCELFHHVHKIGAFIWTAYDPGAKKFYIESTGELLDFEGDNEAIARANLLIHKLHEWNKENVL